MLHLLKKVTLGLSLTLWLALCPIVGEKSAKPSANSQGKSATSVSLKKHRKLLRITTSAIDGTVIALAFIVGGFFMYTTQSGNSRLEFSLPFGGAVASIGSLISMLVQTGLVSHYHIKNPKEKAYPKAIRLTLIVDVSTLVFSLLIGLVSLFKQSHTVINPLPFIDETSSSIDKALFMVYVVYGVLSLGTALFRFVTYWELPKHFKAKLEALKEKNGSSKRNR